MNRYGPIPEILEYQGSKPLGASSYSYLGPLNGLYAFQNGDTGKTELFARHKPGTGDADWHLRRGSYVYEFCGSVF